MVQNPKPLLGVIGSGNFVVFRSLRGYSKSSRQTQGSASTIWVAGYGAMFEAYQDLPAFRNAQYYGYDISAGMLQQARANISDPRAVWIHSHEATHRADFSLVSGTYNLNMNADGDLWRQYVEENLLQLWSKTRVALGFNMLSAIAPKRQKTFITLIRITFSLFAARKWVVGYGWLTASRQRNL